jgi:hypothetical protein
MVEKLNPDPVRSWSLMMPTVSIRCLLFLAACLWVVSWGISLGRENGHTNINVATCSEFNDEGAVLAHCQGPGMPCMKCGEEDTALPGWKPTASTQTPGYEESDRVISYCGARREGLCGSDWKCMPDSDYHGMCDNLNIWKRQADVAIDPSDGGVGAAP